MNPKKLQALYSLKWNPFSPDVPIEALWLSPRVELFCSRLEYQVKEGGFALITGEPGTGKSVALRLLAHRLAQLPELNVGVLTRPQSRLADFYRELGALFGLSLVPHNRWGGFKGLRERWLAHLEQTLYRPVLLVDEAQEMQPAVLAELRLLASMDFDSRSLLTVVLCGDSRLMGQLKTDELLPIASRIRARLLLDGATPKELSDLLQHAAERAGNPTLMTHELMLTLAEHSAGLPRVLMHMAHDLLLAGLERERDRLDEKLYLEVFAQPRETRPRTRPQPRL
jgi:type II secretory pathway predicted ATPase ExeA